MKKEMSKRIAEVVNANKAFLAIEDMATEFDLDAQQIRRYCKLNNIKVISPKQVLINYMHDMKGRKTLDEIAAATGYCIGYLHILLKGLKEEPEDYKVVPYVKKTFTQMRLEAALREDIIERLDVQKTGPHFKDKYTQGGTPFGLADQLNGLSRR